MTKFILGFILLIVITLTAYISINPKSEKSGKSMVTTQPVRKTKVFQKQVQVPVEGTKVVKVSSQATAKKYAQTRQKIIKKVPQNISANVVEEGENKISENFILDSIEDKDISAEEKEHIRDDMIYYQEIHNRKF